MAGRFRRLERQLAGSGRVRSAGGLAATIGRRKYGRRRFGQLAAAGRRRAQLRRSGRSTRRRSS